MNCVTQSIKSKHFLLSKGTYKWDSVYSLNILCLHTCMSQVWFIVKQILDLEVRTPPPLFFWHRPALGGCPASGGRHMATVLLWGSTSDHYQAMTHHLARGYGQKITKAIFLGNSFYFLIHLVKHVWPSSLTLHILWQSKTVQIWAVCQLKVEGLGKRKFTGHLREMIEGLYDGKVIDTAGIKFWLLHLTALSKFSNVSEP